MEASARGAVHAYVFPTLLGVLGSSPDNPCAGSTKSALLYQDPASCYPKNDNSIVRIP